METAIIVVEPHKLATVCTKPNKKSWLDVLKASTEGPSLAKAIFIGEVKSLEAIEELLVGKGITPYISKRLIQRYELNYLRDEVRSVLDRHMDVVSFMPESTINILTARTVCQIASEFKDEGDEDLKL